MSDVLTRVLDNYVSTSGASLKKGPDSIELFVPSPDGMSKARIHTILPGMTLSYFDIKTAALPDSEKNRDLKHLQFNYCVSGRVELLLDDDTYIYLRENDFCLSAQTSKNESFFPAKHYQGIALAFDDHLLSNPANPVLATFGLDISRLRDLYCKEDETCIAEADGEVKKTLGRIWDLFENPFPFYVRLHALELLHLLLENDGCRTKMCAFYTSIQVEIAKAARDILVADLSLHIPVRSLAERFSVSETSLKNYFRGVYGQNISSYMREFRMGAAAKMLEETSLPISEISQRVGYSNQGRFAALFKQHLALAPLEYRRARRLGRT